MILYEWETEREGEAIISGCCPRKEWDTGLQAHRLRLCTTEKNKSLTLSANRTNLLRIS